jgi:anti-sigma factor RsiW
MTRVQILLFAVLVLGPLFSLLMRGVQRRLAGEAPRALGTEAPSVPAPLRTLPVPATVAVAGPRDTLRGSATGRVVTSAAAGGRVPSSLGSHREVRRGIVLMTVLGPCRALEPCA